MKSLKSEAEQRERRLAEPGIARPCGAVGHPQVAGLAEGKVWAGAVMEPRGS